MRHRVVWSLLVGLITLPVFGETWFIRPDGGTRYSGKMPLGQCDGRADVPYRGSGVNQHCAFNDFRFMWDDHSYGNDAWVMTGGDTVIIRGCAANANQVTPSAPHCRIGWDANYSGQSKFWCFGGSGPYGCTNPTIPSGTSTQHTRILGEHYANCSADNVTNRSALTQLFGGFGVAVVLNLAGAQNVDVECLEITSHNGRCVVHGNPAYPRPCNTSLPLDDYDGSGIETSSTTRNILLQDVYIHGHTTSGIQGPIGGKINLNRVTISFNGFAGWNFDDGKNTPDAAGSEINAHYVTMEGNGCNEEYPVVHAFPAMSCYDLNSGGFGDSWSGQQTTLASFTCDHCVQAYNTKDGFIGPHTTITHLTIVDSASYGNMGQQWKWGAAPNSTTIFENNLTVGNCLRMSQSISGSVTNFNRYLSLYCRAAGDVFSFYSNPNSTVLIANNTTLGYSATLFDLNCGNVNSCSTTRYVFRNNIMLGFLNPKYDPTNTNVPGLYYLSDSSDTITADHNLYFNLRFTSCSVTGNICVDPLLVSERARTLMNESELDNFNFHPNKGSPAIGAGAIVGGITEDYFGIKRSSPPSIGAAEPQ
jgi:hypothetical protein